ncbi:uncharacterized protein LOC126670577 [Mercurialis annua]|uniref:uncharacterized protein LOC126670577 n=1 Tax=Mercurialis annua TaxID=3986 RepID=UPI00215FEEDF|nr:uncharacterized protein LOC126670577 [Mercurialis annua]
MNNEGYNYKEEERFNPLIEGGEQQQYPPAPPLGNANRQTQQHRPRDDRPQVHQQVHNQQRQTLGEFFLPDVDNATFGCFAMPDPNEHIAKFLGVLNTFKLHGITADQIKLRMFPFSLREKASIWLHSLSNESIHNWRELAQAFLNKYFPHGKTTKLTKDILEFVQFEGESLHEAWERFKDLQRSVPHHRLNREHVIQIFYDGTNVTTRETIDASSGGSLMQKTYEEALDLVEKLAIVSSTWGPIDRRAPPSQKSLMTLDQVREMEAIKETNVSLQAQVDALKKQVAPMQRNALVAYVQVGCEFYGDFNHSGGECLITGQALSEQVNYVGGQRQANDPYSVTYNPGRRNHPNFGWRNQEGQGNAQWSNQAGPSFQRNNRPPQQKGHYQGNPNHGNNYGAFQSRPQEGLPSTIENNPREHLKAIELRSGRNLEKANGKKHVVEEDEPQVVVDITSLSQELPKECEEEVIKVEERYVRPPPFFLKDIITNKRSWDSGTTAPIAEVCSSIILNDLLAKLKDPGSFSIPCTIGNMSSINCLCDLVASINLMPLTLFRALCGDQTVKSTSMVLQLADHSLKRPYGIVEDVLVKVDKFIFPVDFVILDYAVDKECPIILGRSFMNTWRALIDVHGGKLTLRIDEEMVEFIMKKVMRSTIEEEECMRMDLVDEVVEEQLRLNFDRLNDGLEGNLGQKNPVSDEPPAVSEETATATLGTAFPQLSKVTFYSDDHNDEYSEKDEPKPENFIKNEGITPPSSVVPPIVEMKPLPPHLRYAFVGENKTLSIIISAKSSEVQEKRVVQVVKSHVLAMGWQISDI